MLKPFDLNGLKTYDLQSRPSKVFVEDLGQPLPAGATIGDWLDSLPDQLAGKDLRRVCDHLNRCARGDQQLGLGQRHREGAEQDEAEVVSAALAVASGAEPDFPCLRHV